jgi:beta-hydroxylase
VQQIPGMMTAMFSVLEAGKELPEHRGMYKGLLRYQLGLIVPAPIIHCGIRVGRDVRNWYEGESLIFDDTHPHEVWNYSSSLRAVLFVDFARPLPMPLSLANRTMLKAIASTDVVTSAVRRLREPELLVRAHSSGV